MSNKAGGMVTADGEQTQGLVPKLRFPEFRDAGAWKLGILGDLLSEPKEKNRSLIYGPEHVLSVSGEHGCVNQIELLGRSYAGASVKEYNIVQTGDIVYTKSPLKACPNGIIKANKGATGIVSVLYAVYRPKDAVDFNFIDYYFSSDIKLNNYLQPLVKKEPKNSILVNNTEVLQGAFSVPDFLEQQKIADCLSSLDAVIAAEGDRLAALKDHKKGLMQQLFPAPGQTTPHRRFPEFQGKGEWEVKPLGEVFETASGGTPDRHKNEYWDGEIPWISTALVDSNVILDAAEFITVDGLKNSSAKVFPKGTVLIAMYGQGKTRGKVALLGIDAATNQACAAILPKDGIDSAYVFLNLCSRYDEIRALSNSGGQDNLSQGIVGTLSFPLPAEANEQRKVANCLSSLDRIITAQSDKIDALKTHKAALMQQLFPSPHEAPEVIGA